MSDASGVRPAVELRIDARYRNTNNWKAAADEFNRFFRFGDGRGIKNVGGFRAKSRAGGSTKITDCCFCVLVTNLGETEWPDSLDREEGLFVYYGDNRSPGHALNDTPVGGNALLELVFSLAHGASRDKVPPFLCFESFEGADGMYMRFLGVAAPGRPGVSGLEDLVAVWRIKDGKRFQNYRALFSILEAETVGHAWLEDLVQGVLPSASRHCPEAWRTWVAHNRYHLLRCERTIQVRSRVEQTPRNERERAVLKALISELSPREFEFAAASLVQLMDPRFVNLEVTPAVRDRGRDVVAQYRVGHELHQVLLAAYVEAKQWQGSVGVKPMMRLLSRIKHRDLGVFVTTSYFEKQVQEELREDRHPVILISGGDIARLLIANEIEGPALVEWLNGLKAEAAGVALPVPE